MSDEDAYKVRLMRWSDSSTTGRTVTFKLPDDADEYPFKGLPVGAKNGQMLEIRFSLIDDDQSPETVKRSKRSAARPSPPKPAATPTPGPTLGPTTGYAPALPASTPLPPLSAAPAASNVSAAPSAVTSAPQTSQQPTPHPSTAMTGAGAPTPVAEAPTASGAASTPAGMDIYAAGMSQAAQSLAAVAEKMEAQLVEEDDTPPPPPDPGGNSGVVLVRRAVDLCKAIDKQRAAFFYYMLSKYPSVPALPPEKDGQWSRDAKATRDRVCFHCKTDALDGIAGDGTAERKFLDLENDFERHDRMR